MKEEKKLMDDSRSEYKESKEENSKKYIIIVIFILLCICTYYYSSSRPAKENHTKKPEKQEKIVKKQSPKSKNNNKLKNGQKDKNNKKIQKNKVKKQIIPKAKNVEIAQKKPKEPTSRYDIKKLEIKPFDKNLLANMAFNSIGKTNPFSLKKMYFTTKYDKELPNPPKISDNMNNLPKKKKRKIIVLKGFMDDEVIVSIYGMVRALRVNDSFRGFKALKIDSENLVAEFEKDGKIIARSLESLASITDSKEIRIID